MRIRSISLKKKLLISFVFFLIISFASSMVIYSISERTLREEVITNANTSLLQLRNALDSEIDDILSTMRSFELHPTYKSIMSAYRQQGSLSGYARRQMWQFLYPYAYDTIGDLFIYLPKEDVIISQQYGSSPLALFTQTIFSPDAHTYEEWKALLSDKHLETVMSVRFSSNYQSQSLVKLIPNTGNLMLLTSLPTGSAPESAVTVGCIFSDRILLAHSGNILLYSETAGVLAQSSSIAFPDHLDHQAMAEGTYHDGSGTTYFVNSLPSRHGFQYYTLLENDFFWARLNGLRWAMIASISAYLLFGCMLTVILTRQNYKPISNLVHAVNTSTGLVWDKLVYNELEFVSHTFSSYRKDMMNVSNHLNLLLILI